MIESGLWVILLEAGLALGLVIFIVWWTLPKKPPADHSGEQPPVDDK